LQLLVLINLTLKQKLGSNRIAPTSVPSKNTADFAIEMEPTHGSAASVRSQAEWTEKDSNDQSVIGALTKSSG